MSAGLVAMIGPPGSGKSTFAVRRYGRRSVVSTDALREVWSGDAGDQSASELAYALMYLVVAERLRRGQLVVVDAMNIDRSVREPLLALVRQFGLVPADAVVLRTPLSVCRLRNAARDRRVPDDVIRARHAQTTDITTEDLRWEGWDRVCEVDDPSTVPTG